MARFEAPGARIDDGVVGLRMFGARDLAAFEAAELPGGNDGIWLTPRPGRTPAECLAAHLDGWGADVESIGPSLAVVSVSDDSVLGVVYLGDRGNGSVEVAYGVAPAHRGQGVATRAARLAGDWLLGLGWARVELRIADDALASRRVAAKAGYREAGRVTTFVPGRRSGVRRPAVRPRRRFRFRFHARSVARTAHVQAYARTL